MVIREVQVWSVKGACAVYACRVAGLCCYGTGCRRIVVCSFCRCRVSCDVDVRRVHVFRFAGRTLELKRSLVDGGLGGAWFVMSLQLLSGYGWLVVSLASESLMSPATGCSSMNVGQARVSCWMFLPLLLSVTIACLSLCRRRWFVCSRHAASSIVVTFV